MRLATISAVLGLLIAPVPAGLAQEKPEKTGLRWVPSLERAKQQAAKRHAPILVAIHQQFDPTRDKEKWEAVDRMVKVTYRDREVVRTARRFVCVVVSLGWKPPPGREKTERLFGQLSGKQNQALEERIRADYLTSEDNVVIPQHLILDPDGKLLDRFLLDRKPVDFVRLLKGALARFHGEAPVDAVTADAREVIKGLKAENADTRHTAFRQALAFLGADKNNRAVRDAAEQYLRTLKGAGLARKALNAIDEAGSEGALLLLVPSLKHRNAGVRRRSLDVLAGAAPYKSLLKPLGQRVRTELEEAPLRSLVTALAHYAEELDDALKLLNKLVSHKNDSIKVLATLEAAREGNSAIYGKLLARARAESNVSVRIAAILGLARMKAAKALPTLESVRAKGLEDQNLIQALDAAIAALGGKAPQTQALEKEIRKARRDAGSADDEDDGKGDKKGKGKGKGRKSRGGKRR